MKYLLGLFGFALIALFPLIAFVVGGVIQLVLGAVILLAVLWGGFKILGYLRSLGIISKD